MAVPDHAFLPTADRFAVVAERSEVEVQNAADFLQGVSTLSQTVCVFVAVQVVASFLAECVGASGR